MQAFCDTCGTPVYGFAPDTATYTVRIGSLDERAVLGRPRWHFWTRHRMKWLPAFEGARDVDSQP